MLAQNRLGAGDPTTPSQVFDRESWDAVGTTPPRASGHHLARSVERRRPPSLSSAHCSHRRTTKTEPPTSRPALGETRHRPVTSLQTAVVCNNRQSPFVPAIQVRRPSLAELRDLSCLPVSVRLRDAAGKSKLRRATFDHCRCSARTPGCPEVQGETPKYVSVRREGHTPRPHIEPRELCACWISK